MGFLPGYVMGPGTLVISMSNSVSKYKVEESTRFTDYDEAVGLSYARAIWTGSTLTINLIGTSTETITFTSGYQYYAVVILVAVSPYTITYDSNGGTGNMDDSVAAYGDDITLSANTFARAGYDFAGWSESSSSGTVDYVDEETVRQLTATGSITLYAVWSAHSYTIAFAGNDADEGEMDSISATYDEEYTLTVNAFTREGYKFTGWNTKADGSGTSYDDEATVSNLTTTDGDTVTLYAQWETIAYTIAFDGNGADDGEMEAIDATYDEENTLTANSFRRTGYKFTGWNTEADGSGTSYEDGATVSNLTTTDGDTVTLYAQWEPITYTIAFAGNDADEGEMDSISATYDEEYTLTVNAFTREGYTFTGWNTESDGRGTSYEDEATVSNLTSEDGATVTLYAQWEQITVSITITKVSSDGETTLEGVEFSLYELICEDSSHDHNFDDDLIDTDGYDTICWELFDTYTTRSDGTFTLSDLPIIGIYRLVETETVDDYLLPSGQWSIKFDDLDENEAITVDDVSLQITGISNPPAMTARDGTIYIYNYTSYDIPTTGAVGITQILAIGAIIILIGLVDIMHKKKRKIASLKNSVHNARRIINNWNKKN